MKSVLYIEDEREYGAIVEQLHNMVRKKFYDAVSFQVVPTWVDGASIVEKEPPSVVLVDLSLRPAQSQEDTIFLIERVSRKWPPIFVLTGNKFDLELRKKCILAGADDFMVKDDANRNPELLVERLYHCFLRRIRDEQRA